MQPTESHNLGTGRWCRALAASLALVVGTTLLAPSIALAHAHLKRSDPGAGAEVGAPTTIRLWFTEEPELSLTMIRLTDSTGTVITPGLPSHGTDGALAARFAIDQVLHAGKWTVAWRTAALDGHPSSGTFTFRVRRGMDALSPPAQRPTPRAVAMTEPAAHGASSSIPADPSALTPLYVAARALGFAALLALIGAAAFRLAVLPRAGAPIPADADAIARTVATGAAVAAVAYLLTAGLRLSLQSIMMSGDAAMDSAHMRTMAMETHWGLVWRLQFGAGAAALVGALVARRGSAKGWWIVALASVALAFAAALGGHAGAAESWRGVAVADDALHVLAASGWLGSLLWLAAVALPALARGGAGRAGRVAVLVRAFSPTALGFATLVAFTGLVSAWLRLGSVPALWSTSYGQVLLVKLGLLVGVAGTGFYNWRIVQPALGTDAGSARLARSARVELAIGLLVLLATAVLVATPTPMTP